MAITIVDTVARWSGTPAAAASIASGSFTPASGTLLVVCLIRENNFGLTVTNTGFGGALTWTSRVSANGTDGRAEIVTASGMSGAAGTVVVTNNGPDARKVSAKVYIVTGANNTTPAGASNTATDNSTINLTVNVTATGAGRMFGSAEDADESDSALPTSTDVEDASTSVISNLSAYKSADHSSGTQGINFSITGTATWNAAVLEVMAAGGAADNIYPMQLGVIQQAVQRGAFF